MAARAVVLLDESAWIKAGSELFGSPNGKTASEILGAKLSLNWAKNIALSVVNQSNLVKAQDI
jgi:hypothetical protein